MVTKILLSPEESKGSTVLFSCKFVQKISNKISEIERLHSNDDNFHDKVETKKSKQRAGRKFFFLW